MIRILKKHYIAIIPAIILGILMVLPFFYFRAKLADNFKGILPEIVNDENFYYARIKDVVDGHPFLSNAYLYEHKSGLPQQVFLAEYLLAQPIKLFNLNINTAHLIYNFLFPVIAFILIYLALYLISKSRFWAIIFSLFLFFGLYLIDFIRPVSPQFNFIFWLTQFIFLWLLISERKNKWFWLSVINFGGLFYIYPYYWTFYLIFFAVFIALNFINSKYFHNWNYGSKIFFMVKVNPRKINNPDRMKYLDLLWTSIAAFKSRDEVKNFFKDLLSESESIMLSRRIMIAKYLLEGLTYDEIKARLKVGDGNIAKVHSWLVSGFGGYEKAIQEFNKALDKRGINKVPSPPLSFEWLRKKYPLHFLLFNLFLDKKSNK